jgi:hypothetical protein
MNPNIVVRIAAVSLKLKGEGFEFHLLALSIAITLVIIGGGTWSLDSARVGAQIRGAIRSL